MWYIVIIIWFFSLIMTTKLVLYKGKKYKKDKSNLIKFFDILYNIILSVLILYWLEWLKNPWWTWWNSPLFFWWIIVIFFILLLNLGVKLNKNVFYYRINWFFRLLVGLVTIFLVGKYWFPEWISMWIYKDEIIARWSVIFVWVIFIIEWVLFSVSHLLKTK